MFSWVRAFAVRAALVAAGLAVACLAGELLVRAVAPQQRALSVALRGLCRPDSELGFVMVGGFRRRVHTETFSCDVRTNSIGLRDREPDPPRAGTFRLLGLGDSFAFGVHAGAEANCFLEQLETRLQRLLAAQPEHAAAGREWTSADVVNAGVDGYGTQQEVGLLQRLDPVLHPDAVLLAFYLGNDFTDNSGRTRMTVVDGYQMLEASARGYRETFRPLHKRLRLWLHARSELYLLLKRHLLHPIRSRAAGAVANRKDFDYYIYDAGFAASLRREPSPDLAAGIEATRQALAELRLWRDAHGPALVVAIPAEQQVDPAARRLWVQRFGLEMEAFDYELPQQRLAALCDEAGLPFFDLTPRFAAQTALGDELYLPHDNHWNVAGHALAAETLLEPVLKELVRGAGVAGVTAR